MKHKRERKPFIKWQVLLKTTTLLIKITDVHSYYIRTMAFQNSAIPTVLICSVFKAVG